MTVCVDTNTLIQLFGKQARHSAILEALLTGQLTLAVSNEILFEYQEVVTRMLGPETWQRLLRAVELMEQLYANVVRTEPQFRFHAITSHPDDNKFADCAIAGNADFIITDDQHFAALINARYRPQPITSRVHRPFSDATRILNN
jgi:uncharacterized protein